MLGCIAVVIATSGCFAAHPVVDVVEKAPLNLSDPPPISLSPVNFIVVHQGNVDAVMTEMIQAQEEPVLFCLSGTGYKNLSVNISLIKGHLVAQKKVTNKYRSYYEGRQNGN